jgi:hypothetical protein
VQRAARLVVSIVDQLRRSAGACSRLRGIIMCAQYIYIYIYIYSMS